MSEIINKGKKGKAFMYFVIFLILFVITWASVVNMNYNSLPD